MKLTINDEVILRAFEKDPILSTSKIEAITGIARRTIQGRVKNLVASGYITAHGAGKGSYYKRVFSSGVPEGVIAVLSSGELAGDLSYGGGFYRFVYVEAYKGEMFPGLPKGEISESSALFSYFENFIPEHERREKLMFGHSEIAEVLPYLNNTHGAIDFVLKEELYKYKADYGDRPNWITIKNIVLDENRFPNILDLRVDISDEILNATGNTEYSNLSGYQTKIDITIDWENKRISTSDNADYLLKPRNLEKSDYFGNKDGSKKEYYPFIALNEHLFMSFAKNELGFDVPYSGIIKAKDRDFHYVTKRYDRYKQYKYNQIDFAQYLGVVSSEKYNGSSNRLFEKINAVLSTHNAKMEALRFYYYSYLIKHADFHLKNIGSLNIGQNKHILTPLYDVISVGIYKGNCDDLGLPFRNPYKKPVNWSLKDFYKLGTEIGVSKLQFKKEAAGITRAFITKMPDYIGAVKDLEIRYSLDMQKTRRGFSSFSLRLQSLYNEKIIALKRLGVLEELGLLDLAGGPLVRGKVKKVQGSENE